MSFLFSAPHMRRVPLFSAATCLAAALLAFGPAALAADQLTLAEAQRLALQRSRQVVAQDAAVTAAREMAVAAGQLPDPILKAGVDNVPASGADRGSLSADFMTMRRIGFSQEITRGEKRALRAARYEQEAQKDLADKEKAVAAIERDTALAWLERHYAEAAAALIAAQREQAQHELQAFEAAYRASRGSQSELLTAKSVVAQYDDRASDAARRVRSSGLMLVRWVGDAGQRPLAESPAADTIRIDLGALDTQLAHHPEVQALLRQEDIATTEAKLAEANRKSDWTVEVAYQQRGAAYSNMVSVGVSIPLQWDRKNRQDRELAAKLALADQARAEREEALRMHIAETRAMAAEWETNRERLERYVRELIPLAQKRAGATLAAYRGNKATLADVLSARRNELDVRLSALQLQADTAKLWAQLNFLFPTSHQMPTDERATNRNSQ